jgi:hypothetical protein
MGCCISTPTRPSPVNRQPPLFNRNGDELLPEPEYGGDLTMEEAVHALKDQP